MPTWTHKYCCGQYHAFFFRVTLTDSNNWTQDMFIHYLKLVRDKIILTFLLLHAHIFILVQINAIWAGCQVFGKIGELVDNPTSSPPNGKNRRRVRSLATRTVLCSIDHQRLEVRLDYNSKLVQIASTVIQVSESESRIPMVSYMLQICFTFT